MDFGLYPIASPPDRPVESMAKKTHPGHIEVKESDMRSAGPRVSCSRMIFIGVISKSLRKASFFEALAKPLQLKVRHFMGER